ncbi:MAG: glycosyltransferase [Actinomycetota bacterium]
MAEPVGPGPLRVHLIHQSFGDYVSALVDGLIAADGPDRVELAVTTVTSGAATLSGLRTAAGVEPVAVTSRRVPRFRDPRSPFRAWVTVREMLATEADVVHWQAAGNPWVDLAFSFLMGRRPTVVTIHDMQPHPGDRNVLPGTFAAIRRVARRADRVTVHAPHVRDQVIAAGIAPDRVVVVDHGELASRYLPPDRLPLPPSDQPVVLFFGRAQGYKGLDLLVEAMTILNGDRADRTARLIVAGSGPSIDELFPTPDAVPSWCELRAGHIPAEEVPDLFADAAVVALPYREASQSGVAALTAGFGRPVGATAVPGLADIVADGDTGLLVTPDDPVALADGLAAVLDDPILRDRLGRGAKSAADTRLSWATITAELRAVYRVALDG